MRRILVVDDEILVAEVLTRMLERLGYTSLKAGSGKEALTLLGTKDAAIDLVLLDVMLEDMDGREVVRMLKKQHPDIRILMLSGYDDSDFETETFGGADGFLQKPVSSKRLSSVIQEVTGQRGQFHKIR